VIPEIVKRRWGTGGLIIDDQIGRARSWCNLRFDSGIYLAELTIATTII
jgi:hypothetical protein